MVSTTTAKRTFRKPASKAKPSEKEKVIHKHHHPTHPPWIDMITECIANTPEGTRLGVSRPAIKKFVDSKYHLPMNAADASRLNRAISEGTNRGSFVLPKGPSGKVKLAPKRVGEIAKENKKPALKHPAETKVMMKPLATAKTKTAAVTKEKAPTPKKYISTAKKSRITPIPGRQIPSKKTTSKRGGAKKGVTGSAASSKKATKGTRKVVSASRRRLSKSSTK